MSIEHRLSVPLLSHPIARLMRLDRPVGTWLVLWPAMWALIWATEGLPPWWAVVVVALGSFLMRSAGCVVNDLADRDFDAQVERTRARPLAAGELSPKQGLAVFLILLAAAASLLFLLPSRVWLWALGGAAIAILYPFSKRITHLPQLVMGLAFSWGVVVAWLIGAESLSPVPWLLLLTTLLWSAGYDTLYAIVDRDDDRQAGVRSTALYFDQHDLLAVGLLYGWALLAWMGAGWIDGRISIALVGAVGAGAMLGRQLWMSRARDRGACFAAFRENRWVGAYLAAVVWLGMLLNLP